MMTHGLVSATETASPRMDERQHLKDESSIESDNARMQEFDSPYVIPSPEPPVAPLFMNGRRAVMDGYIHAQEKELARTQRTRRSHDLAAVERGTPAGSWWRWLARLRS